ncbi:hypothetical protein [Staphylococcus saprophyticus]|uniref:hypothetical protein n=1 Tax=Staphylococcus saprophyticus TaxID=29385 RepID=UPI001783CFED|nr:hypothetical protein [Staphylococcus saprophyticus]
MIRTIKHKMRGRKLGENIVVIGGIIKREGGKRGFGLIIKVAKIASMVEIINKRG